MSLNPYGNHTGMIFHLTYEQIWALQGNVGWTGLLASDYYLIPGLLTRWFLALGRERLSGRQMWLRGSAGKLGSGAMSLGRAIQVLVISTCSGLWEEGRLLRNPCWTQLSMTPMAKPFPAFIGTSRKERVHLRLEPETC